MKIRVVYNTWTVSDGLDYHTGRIKEYKDERRGIEIEWDSETPDNYEEIEELIRSKL